MIHEYIDEYGFVYKKLMYDDMRFMTSEINCESRKLMESIVELRKFQNFVPKEKEGIHYLYDTAFSHLWSCINDIMIKSDDLLLLYNRLDHSYNGWSNFEAEAEILKYFKNMHYYMHMLRLQIKNLRRLYTHVPVDQSDLIYKCRSEYDKALNYYNTIYENVEAVDEMFKVFDVNN
jgi:hypothetical protein